MPRAPCARCGGNYDEGPRVAGLCVACQAAPARPEDAIPDLVVDLVRLGAREAGTRIIQHPVGLAVVSLVTAHRQARQAGRPSDWPSIFQQAAELIRTTRGRAP
jgi:hypothetical protein